MELNSKVQEPFSNQIPTFAGTLVLMFAWAERLNKKFEEFKNRDGLTMAALSEKSGVAYDTVNKCLRGEVENPRGDTMEKLAKALGTTEVWLRTGSHPAKPAREHNREEDTQGEVARPNLPGLQFPVGAQTVESWPKDLKIIGHAKAGQKGFFLDQGEYHGMAYRPPALSTVKDAFAIYVHDDSMEPAFEPGQIAWVHPTRPVAPGNNIIIEMTDGQAFIKRLVRRTEKFIVCKQWNPAAETKFDTSKIKRLYYVVGSYRED